MYFIKNAKTIQNFPQDTLIVCIQLSAMGTFILLEYFFFKLYICKK